MVPIMRANPGKFSKWAPPRFETPPGINSVIEPLSTLNGQSLFENHRFAGDSGPTPCSEIPGLHKGSDKANETNFKSSK